MHRLYPFLVTAHVLAAAIWVGGLITLWALTMHLRRRLPDETYRKILEHLGQGFRPWAWGALGLLFLSGWLLAQARGMPPWIFGSAGAAASAWGKWLQIKVALVLAVALLTTLHDRIQGPRALRTAEQLARYRRTHRFVGLGLLLLSLVALILGVLLARGWQTVAPGIE